MNKLRATLGRQASNGAVRRVLGDGQFVVVGGVTLNVVISALLYLQAVFRLAGEILVVESQAYTFKVAP